MQKDEREIRLEKLQKLREMGIIPYKDSFNRKNFSTEIDTDSVRDYEEVTKAPQSSVKLAGRILSVRDHGGIIFFNLQDVKGEIQIGLKEGIIKDEQIKFFKDFIDLGDFVGIVGEPFYTKQNKLTILATELHLLSKTIRALPSQHFGIQDIEIKYRQRYLDLLLNKETKERFIQRSNFVEALRRYLLQNDFLELTTRTLQTIPGGALAKPFKTHHDRLDLDLYLRISNELDLKMVIGGGFERVFEFAIDFRNEGVDSDHLQEFQILEWYSAYENYEQGIQRTEELLKYAVQNTFNTTKITITEGVEKPLEIDFAKSFERITYVKLLQKYNIDVNAEEKELQKIAMDCGITEKEISNISRGSLIDLIYKKKVRPYLLNPIFITSYPEVMLPLARLNDKDSTLTDSYQLVIKGTEILKGYSELIDPTIQRQKLEEQQKLLKKGDEGAMRINEEFITALEHGLPPLTGWGMGVDRIIALLTNQKNLKDVVLFPLLDTKQQS